MHLRAISLTKEGGQGHVDENQPNKESAFRTHQSVAPMKVLHSRNRSVFQTRTDQKQAEKEASNQGHNQVLR